MCDFLKSWIYLFSAENSRLGFYGMKMYTEEYSSFLNCVRNIFTDWMPTAKIWWWRKNYNLQYTQILKIDIFLWGFDSSSLQVHIPNYCNKHTWDIDLPWTRHFYFSIKLSISINWNQRYSWRHLCSQLFHSKSH